MKHSTLHWTDLPMPGVFEADYGAWLKSLSRKARNGQPGVMRWEDLGPYAHCAYGLHRDLATGYRFLVNRNRGPATLPDDCTPQGFYLAAVETRRAQVGKAEPLVPTPYTRLSAFSQFIYGQLAGRVAAAAGFGKHAAPPPAADDGLGDGLDEPDDGLNAPDGLDEPDDGLDGLDAPDDGLDGLDGLDDLALQDDGL